jgi:hypothetical protein
MITAAGEKTAQSVVSAFLLCAVFVDSDRLFHSGLRSLETIFWSRMKNARAQCILRERTQ